MQHYELLSIKDKLREFEAFLVAKGAELLEPTNEFEVIRFVANGVTGIVYKKASGFISHANEEAKKAWFAFKNKKPYQANKVSKRVKKNVILNTLLNRDGFKCFYCRKEMREEEMTIEHLLSINMGGRNHLANLAISCQSCNQEAGHKSLIEKIKMRESKIKEDK